MNCYHIVYATDHNFVFMCAVSIASLLEHKNKKDNYIIHILSDGSIDEEDRTLFSILENHYYNATIMIHGFSNEELDKACFVNSYYNKMTLYRLLLPSILEDIDKCVYLDSDTLVCGDIAELFSIGLNDFYLAAVRDSDIEKVVYYNKGNLDLKDYFNAGVLVLNLDKLRKDGMEEKFLKSVGEKWQFNDQDILNKLCENKVKFLDVRYNQFSYSVNDNNQPIIMHYLGEPGMRPWEYFYARNREKWWEVASIFKDTSIYVETRSKVEERYKKTSFRYVIEQCKVHDSIFIFGCGFYGKKIEKSLARNGVLNIEAFLDNNDKVVGTEVAGHKVISPEDVGYHKDNYYIISVRDTRAQESIEHQLMSLGATKEQILCYVENPPEVYHYMDPKYQAEERENVLLRELGSGTARLGWDLNKHG